MLTVIITPKKESIVTADGKTMRVYRTLIEEDNELHSFQERTDYRNVNEVEIFTVSRYLFFWALRLRLTPEIKRGIIDFLHVYHARQNLFFNCYSFACLVYGIDWQSGPGSWIRFWQIKKPKWRRKVGDVIFLVSNGATHFHHAAIYIGLGLYLSVYGGGGDLEIATLQDMKIDYGADAVVQVVPRA